MTCAALLSLGVGTDCTKVISEALGVRFANLVKIFNDGITCHDLYLISLPHNYTLNHGFSITPNTFPNGSHTAATLIPSPTS